jgi:hypothetical protein
MANEEAARLAETSDTSGAQDREPEKQAKFLRVRVVEDDHPAVNVKVPIGVAKWGMKMAQTFSPEMKDANLDWESITAIIQKGGARSWRWKTKSTTRPLKSGWNNGPGQRPVERPQPSPDQAGGEGDPGQVVDSQRPGPGGDASGLVEPADGCTPPDCAGGLSASRS